MYALVGYFILILMSSIKCEYRLGSSQHSPQNMRVWERMHNFIVLKNMWVQGLKATLCFFSKLVN